ncbi:hypothetical protein CpipJ_CPIJ018498 [Culex quinquefasciatus]|uniref:Uncharacterized protein n=1 Tax=Culex quinquefasciatus TaxID=7176 RepID=B0XG65_CULQU|nr:hypothetical protein CpipJ_CPIJ018498 [Culex quinquefasciatus]|eukprot:XP_001868637.1 hypothetical protein CpipJ_CPIJ018498 [Culex quinquefasciatus]
MKNCEFNGYPVASSSFRKTTKHLSKKKIVVLHNKSQNPIITMCT